MDDFIGREKQHRTRSTVLQSAGKVRANAGTHTHTHNLKQPYHFVSVVF